MRKKRVIAAVGFAIALTLIIGVISQLGRNYPTNTVCKADLADLKSQLEFYKEEQGVYPNTAQGLQALVNRPSDVPIPEKWHQRLRSLPMDPWKRPYNYIYPGLRNTMGFDLYSLGPDGVPSADDIYAKSE